MIVGTTVPWGAIQGLAGTNQFNVLGTNPDFVKSMHTDMDGGDLVDHGELFTTLNVAGLEVEECPVADATTNEAGETTSVAVDLVPFGFQTGILIAEE